MQISTSPGSGSGLPAGEPAERLALALPLRFCTPPARGAPRSGLEALRLGPAFFRPFVAEDFSGDVAAPAFLLPGTMPSAIARRSSGVARSTCARSSPYSLKSKLVTASRPRRIMAAWS